MAIVLDPKPSSIGNTIISHIVDFIVPPPVRIPLVPEIDLAKAPSTSRLNLKRKVNTAFITSDERAPKRQTIHRIQSSGNKGQQNGKGSGRGGPQGNDNRGGSSSDSDGAWSDTDSEFDYLLPPHSRSSGKVSTTYKKKDGTWKIKIEPDLEDVMKVDITGSEPSTTRRTGGRAVVNARPGQFNTPAPKPTVGARKVHIKNPIIQDPQSHSSITEDSSSEPVPSLFAEKDNPSNGSARTTEIIQPGQHLAGTIAQSRSSPPSSTPVPTGMAPTGDASKAVPTPSPGNICKLFPSPPRNDNTRFGNTTWLSAAPVTQPGSFSIFGTMGPSSISVTRPQDNDAARVPGRQEIYETLMATTEVDLSASADTTAFQQRPGPRPTTTSKPTYAEILKRTPSVQQPAESPERAAFETQENLVSFLNSHIMSPSIAPGNASAAEYSWSRLKTPTDTAGNTNHSKSPQSRLSTPVDTAGLTPIAAKLYEELADDFDAKFPRGFKILRTSGTRLLCALYAIMDSMKAQYPREEQPTLEDLNRSFKNPVDEDIIAAKEHADMGNHNDLSLDQATSTLYDWGMRRGKVWQLAAYVPAQKRQHMMVGIPERPGARRLWIQNNATQAELDAGIEAEKKEEANRGGHGLGLSDLQDLHAIGFDNHYSGLEAN